MNGVKKIEDVWHLEKGMTATGYEKTYITDKSVMSKSATTSGNDHYVVGINNIHNKNNVLAKIR